MHHIGSIALGDFNRRCHGLFYISLIERQLLLQKAIHNERPKRAIHPFRLKRPHSIAVRQCFVSEMPDPPNRRQTARDVSAPCGMWQISCDIGSRQLLKLTWRRIRNQFVNARALLKHEGEVFDPRGFPIRLRYFRRTFILTTEHRITAVRAALPFRCDQISPAKGLHRRAGRHGC
jgi:hypothetical protein